MRRKTVDNYLACSKRLQQQQTQQHTQQHRANTTMSASSQRNWHIWHRQQQLLTAPPLLLLLLALLAHSAVCQHADISQISPKSSSDLAAVEDMQQSTVRLTIESTMTDMTTTTTTTAPQAERVRRPSDENQTRAEHARVERSASPILNENFPKSGPNDVHFPSDDVKAAGAGAGRYFQYNIKPTGTYDAEIAAGEQPERTQRARAGKTLAEGRQSSSSGSSSKAATVAAPQPFLVKGDLRPLTSGSPINPTSSSATSMAASATAVPHSARQNGNPDIQDIITGIVKLLNGNVNVHANTQGIRRPSASRINNRGPPRISEVQTLPIDYEAQKPGTSMRPPPYPFDRPERPFITGVPIPEQIVPLRPGFVSNRPPWYRNKPRPPITTTNVGGGGRRPIPQYKPPVQAPQQQQQPYETVAAEVQEPALAVPTHMLAAVPDNAAHNSDALEVAEDTADAARPTDTTYDSEFSNEDTNTQYIEVGSEHDVGLAAAAAAAAAPAAAVDVSEKELQTTTSSTEAPLKKAEHAVGSKKKQHKPSGDKKKHSAQDYSTIIETSSVVHTIMGMSSSYMPMSTDSAENIDLDPSSEEVIFMTANRTPTLETTSSSSSISEQQANLESSSSSSSSITTTPLSALPPEPSSVMPTNVMSTPTTSTTTSTTTISSFTTATTSTTSTTSTTTTPTTTTEKAPTNADGSANPTPPSQYKPRPGIVLDDPEFKPGGRPRPQRPPHVQAQQPATRIQPTRQQLPPGYGEIFDVTLSAIQGPGTGSGSQQTINIKPYGAYGGGGGGGAGGGVQGDIIVSATGDEGFVSIDGKRTYINLFGDPTDPPTGAQSPTTPATRLPQLPIGMGAGGGGSGAKPHAATQSSTGYAVPETEVVELEATKAKPARPNSAQAPSLPPAIGSGASQSQSAAASTTTNAATRPHYRPRPTQPPVRIDTCIVGDDSTCDQAQHERCKTENGVSSCHCRPGYSRRKHREPCRKVISFYVGMRVDRIYEHRIVWDNKLLDRNSEPYGQLSYESTRAIDSAMSMTPYSDEFMDAKVNNIYRGDPQLGGSGVFVNLTIKLDESIETLRPNLRTDVQKHLLGVLHRRNNNIGNSVLYVTSPEGAVSALHDLDECQSLELNDCHASASCSNTWGSFRCACEAGLRDPWADQPQRAGRECQACADAYCNNRGTCAYNDEGSQVCTCDSSHYGAQCEIDGEVLGVAIGASVAAVIIIVLTLVCLIMWSRRWQREQKNAMGSPVFGYMNTAPLKSAGLPQAAYQVTLEDRMRWAQIADVMAQTNHYGAEPIGPTRPSSAMFAYPNLHTLGMGTIGGMSMQSTMQMHQNAALAPPVPLPRLGLSARANGMRTLENSSSSEEEDRADLLGRNFQVPRPKSRSNGSIANQSGIYYDVDYEPSGNGIGNTSVDHLYGSQNQSVASHSHIPGPQGIPMSTYTSGRAPSSYYMK